MTYLKVLERVSRVGLTQVELGKVVGAAPRTVQTWAAGDVLPTGLKAQRLLDIETIVSLLQDSYTDEGIRIWFNARNRNLDFQRPVELLLDGQIDVVLNEARTVAGEY